VIQSNEQSKERPILFSAPMVRAILRGSKTQTRRIVKDDTLGRIVDMLVMADEMAIDFTPVNFDFGSLPYRLQDNIRSRCPYGVPGDRLWVRETHSVSPPLNRRPISNPAGYPDVKYRAVSPTLAARFPVTATIAAFGEGDVLLINSTGAIQKPDQYGSATVFGFEAGGGVDVALGRKFTLRFEGELSQIGFKFKGNGAMAMARGVKAATDRSLGAVATLAVTY